MGALGWVDLAMLVVLALSVLVGLVRGFTLELLSLAGWVVGLVAAQAYTHALAPHVPVGQPDSPLRFGASFALIFFGALLVWGLLSRLVSMLIKASPLSGLDRLFGALFGVLRAGVLLLALSFIVGLTPWHRSPDWQASRGAVWLGLAVQAIAPYLPEGLSRHLPAVQV